MKKGWSVLLLLFLAIAAFGQPKDMDPEKRLAQMNKNMKEQLKLTDDQYAKVTVINESFVNEMSANRGKGNQEAAEKAQANHRVELAKVLTKEQLITFDEQMQNRKQKRGMPGKGAK